MDFLPFFKMEKWCKKLYSVNLLLLVEEANIQKSLGRLNSLPHVPFPFLSPETTTFMYFSSLSLHFYCVCVCVHVQGGTPQNWNSLPEGRPRVAQASPTRWVF